MRKLPKKSSAAVESAVPLEPFFAGSGLERADHLRGSPEVIAALAKQEDAKELVWKEGLPSVLESGELEWTTIEKPDLFLGFDGKAPRFSPIPLKVENARPAFAAMTLLSRQWAPVFAAAISLGGWHARNGFCSNCGFQSLIDRGGWSRTCPNCGAEHYPRVDPVVIMLVEHGELLLLGRQAQFATGRYSALAGFVEAGETIEAAVAREICEEAGIEISNVTYLSSQPWPFPSSLMIGCRAQAQSLELSIDTNELEDARWFSRDEVQAALDGSDHGTFAAPLGVAIARSLIEEWLTA